MPDDNQMNSALILIAGAGPTGLVLALWLAKSGVAVRIFDKAAEAGTSSRALGVQARTLELYRQMGIANEVLSGGVEVAGGNFWVGGKRVARIGLADAGKGRSPFAGLVCFPQDAHERMLIAQLLALGVTVERSTELLRFSDGESVIRATIRRADGAEEECEASYLAGCDGAHSAVRTGLAIGFPGGTYDELFYVADANVTGPVANQEVHVDFGTADFLAVFPMRGEGRVRLIGTVIAETDVEQQKLTFADVSGQAIDDLKITVQKLNWFSTYRVHHRVADRFRKGRVFLLGDAAHVHSPVGAQGMNTGIGDAINLAWKLAAVVKGEASAALLDSFEPERIAFARRLVATTDRIFTFATKRGAFAAFVRTQLMPMVFPMLSGMERVRSFIFRTISQTGIEYRGSSLSEGVARAVHGGDRLPWVPIGASDNFIPLTSMAWQAHCYGDAKPAARAACAELRLPLHTFAWIPQAHRAGLARSALYLVRPDGYVALANRDGEGAGLREYFRTRGITIAGA